MNVQLLPGKYVIAVSGGVDSVVLLDLLAGCPNVELIVAHFDHGIRDDSLKDRQLVETLSQKYQLPFEVGEGKLGPGVSEEEARLARYAFLRQIRKKHGAAAIVTAHHQDDALETAAFNLLRGTKRKGVTSLQSTDAVVRPLIDYSKDDIKQYAHKHNLVWREDSTNSDERYARNWLRRTLLPRLNRDQKRQLHHAYKSAKVRNDEVDVAISEQLDDLKLGEGLNRQKFIALPYSVAAEVMAAWLRQNDVQNIDRRLIDVLVVSAKTLPPGKRISVRSGLFLTIGADRISLG